MLALLTAVAALSNIGTVYFLKASNGMTVPWATLSVVISILITQWILGYLMVQGVQVAIALTTVVVTVMVGSAIVGIFFDERPSLMQCAGYVLAIVGVAIATLSTSTK